MSEGKSAATPQMDRATIDALIAELVEPGFVLHGEDGDITYFNIGEWLRSKRSGSVAAPKAALLDSCRTKTAQELRDMRQYRLRLP